MQQTPVIRAVRFTVFSIGFMLFIVMAIRSGHNATDPQMVKGKPSFFSFAHTDLLSGMNQSARYASHVSAPSTPSSASSDSATAASATTPAGSEHDTAPAALSGSLPVQANAQAYAAQERAAAKQAQQAALHTLSQ